MCPKWIQALSDMGDFNQVAIPGATYARKYQKYKCIVMDVEIHICMSGGTHAL